MANMLGIKQQISNILGRSYQQKKFTMDQWMLNNAYKIKYSETQQRLADHLIAASKHICELTNEKVKLNREETDYRLREKLENIKFLKEELLRTRKEVVSETDALLTYKERIISALHAVRRNALEICLKCLVVRSHRLGIDLVDDEVQTELKKECEVIKKVENLLVRVSEQCQEQIRKLKSTFYFMDHDLEDKESNIKIDQNNMILRETDPSLCIHDTDLKPSIITLKEWEAQTRKNVISAFKELNTARSFRSYVNKILIQVTEDLNDQKNATDTAFLRRIRETKDIKTSLENQHAMIMQQANEMNKNIANIEKSLAEKEGFMALSTTRFANRCQRPGLEFTIDQVENSLTKEIIELKEVISQLQKKLYEAQNCLRYLLRSQIQLEEEINIKTNTLKIDEVDCVTLRQDLNYNAY